jgi:hypothetical protein
LQQRQAECGGFTGPGLRDAENIVPGLPTFYATTIPRPGGGFPILIETHEGRPTKIEGNPDHPASLGATDAITLLERGVAQALVLKHRLGNVGRQANVGRYRYARQQAHILAPLSEQARMLRAAADAGWNAPIDWVNVAEEIESLGRSERHARVSHIGIVIEHLLKLQASPATEPVRG